MEIGQEISFIYDDEILKAEVYDIWLDSNGNRTINVVVLAENSKYGFEYGITYREDTLLNLLIKP